MKKRFFWQECCILVAVLLIQTAMRADIPKQRKSVLDTYPITYSDWANGMLAGNGKMGVIVFGNPLDETVIYNDRKFFYDFGSWKRSADNSSESR